MSIIISSHPLQQHMLTLYTNNLNQITENHDQKAPCGKEIILLIPLITPPNKAGITPAYQYKIDNVEICNYLATCKVNILRVPLVTCTTFNGNGVSQVGLPKTCMSFLIALKMPKDTQA